MGFTPIRAPSALAKAVAVTLGTPVDGAKLKARGEVFSLEASAKDYLALLRNV